MKAVAASAQAWRILELQVVSLRPGAGQVPGDERNGVRYVGGDRGDAERHQRRERDQGPAAGQCVNGPGRPAGTGSSQVVEDVEVQLSAPPPPRRGQLLAILTQSCSQARSDGEFGQAQSLPRSGSASAGAR